MFEFTELMLNRRNLYKAKVLLDHYDTTFGELFLSHISHMGFPGAGAVSCAVCNFGTSILPLARKKTF